MAETALAEDAPAAPVAQASLLRTFLNGALNTAGVSPAASASPATSLEATDTPSTTTPTSPMT